MADDWVTISEQDEWETIPEVDEWETIQEPKQLPTGGGLAEFGKGIVRGTLGVAKGFVGTITALAGTLPTEKEMYKRYGLPEPTDRVLAETKARPFVEAKRRIAGVQKRIPITHRGASAWAGRVIGEAIPYMGTALTGGYLVGLPGAAMVGFAVEGDNAYDEAIATGASEDQAQTERMVVGSINAAIEALQIGRLMKFHKTGRHSLKGFVNAARKRSFKEMARTGRQFSSELLRISIEEGIEEFSQEGVSLSVPAILRDEYPRKADDSPDWWAIGNRLGEAALGGAVAGGVLGGAGVAIGGIPGVVTERAPAEIAPEVAEPVVEEPVVEEPTPVVEKPVVKRKPYKGQYAVGHKIPEILGMKTKERRAFMEETAGVRSMKEMTPSTAQDYIDVLHQLAREKGIDTITLPQGHKFKRPVLPLPVPQLYEIEKLGIKFMLDPAIIGKQELDLEFAKMAKVTDKVERQINKLGGETLASKAKAKFQNKPTKSVARFADLLNTHEEAPADLSEEEKAIFNYFRGLNRTIIQQENAIREELDLEPITYKPGYMRHIVDTLALDIIDERHPIPEEVKYWAEKHATMKITNPMEFQRKLGDELADIFSNDIIKATKAMLWTGLKEIHLDKPLKFFENQMGLHSESMPAATRLWAEKFINEMIVGQQTNVDQAINNWIVEGGIGKVVNKALRLFGRRISPKPYSRIMMKAGRFQIYGVMGWRPKQLIRNKFQLVQNLALYTLRSNIKGFFPVSKQLKSLLSESLFLKTYKGFEELREIDKRTLGRLWLAPFGWTAVSNARQAMKVAYWDTLELITDPKYKNLGWADPQRTFTEEREFLYPSEKEKILKEMEFGAGVTQYHYIPMAMPQAFRYKAAIPFTRLQSWWMNHFFKFHTEAATRFFKGETAYGAKLPWSRRVGWGRYLVLGGIILNTLGYTSSFLFGAAPEGLPPLFQVVWNLYKLCVVSDKRARRSAKRKLFYALKTFIPGHLAYKDVTAAWENKDDLTQLFFYRKGIFKPEEEETWEGL